MNKKIQIKKINQATNERYNKRFVVSGVGAHTLGWGKEYFQIKRFNELLYAAGEESFVNKTVLDIGCGFGDLYTFLGKKHIKLKKYIGTDVNENFIKVAKNIVKPGHFVVRDLMIKPYAKPVADVGVALGVINFKQKNHEEYAYEFIKSAFSAVKEKLIINVISDVHNENYPRESFIYYYKPARWLELAQKITPFCSLIHDYAGEPQYEFMLILNKKPWKLKK
jgi:SAM-dependent methyltransferase